MLSRRILVRGFALLFGVVSLTACGGEASRETDPIAEGEVRRARPIDKLASMLERSDTLQMPPTGRQDHAEQLETKVTLATFAGDIDALARENAKEPLRTRFDVPESDLERVKLSEAVRFDSNDTIFESGVENSKVEDYLVDELIKSARRDQARTLVRNVAGKYYRFVIYNRAAELIAEEWIYIVPDESPAKVLTVHFSYYDE